MGMFTLLPTPISVKTPEQAYAVLSEYQNEKILAYDTETTGLSRSRDRAVLLALSNGKSRYCVYPEMFPYFKDFLENPEVKLIAHNANFDQWMLLNSGINLNRHCVRNHYRIYDTMVMHTLIDEIEAHGLKPLAKQYLGIEMTPFNELFAKQLRKRSYEEVFLDPANEELATSYASLDAYATYKLFIVLQEELKTLPAKNGYQTLWDYFFKTEVPYTRILFEMEYEGIEIDKEALLEQAPAIEEELVKIQKWLGRSMGKLYVNPNSNKELSELFFGQLGYKPVSYTDKGAAQLNDATLSKWDKKGCEYARAIRRYREIDKKLGTYITNLLKEIHTDNRIHATFNQTGARTGRLSSSVPNLQNQPRFIRNAFVSSNGTSLFAADYSQLEMRILAHFSGDDALINAIKSGQDVHTSTAAKMFKVPYEDIMAARKKDDDGEELSDGEQKLLKCRTSAKAINFGLMYGQGSGRLADTLSCSIDEAKMLIRQYFSTFPKITKYFKSAISKAADVGYCSTILGRRRLVPGLHSNSNRDRSDAERQVKNSPIQGSAADITRLAMIRLWEDPLIEMSGTKMLIQVHDEIVFSVPDEFVDNVEFNQRVVELMTHPFDFDLIVPLETSSKYGENWKECK
jgi:DNA polymerase-1